MRREMNNTGCTNSTLYNLVEIPFVPQERVQSAGIAGALLPDSPIARRKWPWPARNPTSAVENAMSEAGT